MIVVGPATAKTDLTVLARILGAGGVPITKATISTITYAVRDLDAPGLVAGTVGLTVGTGTFSPAAVVYDSLQTGPPWTQDSAAYPGPDGLTGYNFAATIPGALLVNGGDRHQADFLFTTAAGAQFDVTARFTLLAVYT